GDIAHAQGNAHGRIEAAHFGSRSGQAAFNAAFPLRGDDGLAFDQRGGGHSIDAGDDAVGQLSELGVGGSGAVVGVNVDVGGGGIHGGDVDESLAGGERTVDSGELRKAGEANVVHID